MPMPLELHMLGRADYAATVQAMQDYTATRTPHSPDMLLMCEHEAVYTQGLAGKNEHILAPGHIPVVATNRGGQVTFHGPGQVVAYPLIDLQRAGYYVKEYVHRLEEAVLRTLAHFGVTGHRVAGAPGIYVRLADPTGHAMLPQRPRNIERSEIAAGSESASEPGSRAPAPDFPAWARSRRWASRSAGTAATTAWRSTWRWTSSPLRASTLVVMRSCAP